MPQLARLGCRSADFQRCKLRDRHCDAAAMEQRVAIASVWPAFFGRDTWHHYPLACQRRLDTQRESSHPCPNVLIPQGMHESVAVLKRSTLPIRVSIGVADDDACEFRMPI
ncbi:hypothetical protein EMIT0111MI5_180008 [Burkholderia sp. IT-111MI5]